MYPAALVRLLRPHFAGIGLVLFIVGALYASALGAAPSLAALTAGYLCMVIGHLAINVVNDYFDREDDRHGSPTPFSGGSGVLQQDPDLARTAFALALGLSALSLLLTGAYWLAFGPNPWFAGLVLTGLALGWAYSAPPLRFSARGIGEVSTAFAFVLMPGFGYAAAAGHLDAAFVPLALPLLLLGFSFILAVELPDLEADVAAGRKNFTVRHGRNAASRGMALAAGGSVIAWAFVTASGTVTPAFALAGLALSLLPFASAVSAAVRPPSERSGATHACALHVTALLATCAGLAVVLATTR